MRLSAWKNVTNRVIDLPVKLARILANLLANLDYDPRISVNSLANLLRNLLSEANQPIGTWQTTDTKGD